MAPLEPWERVLISDDFLTSTHGSASCIDCHGGQASSEKEIAHEGIVADPTIDMDRLCGTCHKDIVDQSADSLHTSLNGYYVSIYSRSVPENHPAIDEAFGNHCLSCHTSCGDCHISQPDSVGGGFLDGHNFVKSPPMTRTCTACHGSRVGAEYLGKNEDIPGDVHFRIGRMKCTDCHTGPEMHGTDPEMVYHRYAGDQQPACEDCHTEIGSDSDTISQHAIHTGKLSCQVCHSVEYTSCDGCHVAISEKSGNPFYKTDGDYLTFYIAKNSRVSEERPYEYVTVRHIPVAVDSFEFYGEDLLPNFNLLPTWASATPHNIQRITPQNQSCNNCHGNSEIFLTADKVNSDELEANAGIIVDELPPLISGQ
ncbi:MAG: hypothetical protein HPY76_11000 [Anaerolineae bacterium]|nr:hypothetical protein [Anaerolineae bacterium]